MNIRLFGIDDVSIGIGIHFESFSESLTRYSMINTFVHKVGIKPSDCEKPINIEGEGLDIFFNYFEIPSKRKRVCVKWAIFEVDKLPEKVISYYDNSDAIWVPSKWGKEVLIKSGLDESKIDIIPEGVNTQKFHPFCRSCPKKNSVFRFLALGKYEPRKGYSELLQGFSNAFGDDDTVELTIKAEHYFPGYIGSTKKELEAKLEFLRLKTGKRLSNVKIISGKLGSDEIFRLYNQCDAMICTSRAEGWGLPLIEGIASGLPVISTCYSGHSEYLNCIKGLFIELEYKLKAIDDKIYIDRWELGNMREPAKWAVANVNAITEAFIEMRCNSGKYRQYGLDASAIIRRHYSWELSVEKAIRAMQARGIFDFPYT